MSTQIKKEKDPKDKTKKIKKFEKFEREMNNIQKEEMDKEAAESDEFKKKGKIHLSFELVPWKDVELDPVGMGREEPNKNPTLPPPTGRMSFSLNPYTMLK